MNDGRGVRFMIICHNLNGLNDKMFFCLVDESFEELLEKVEFGNFIYGKDVNKLLNNSRLL